MRNSLPKYYSFVPYRKLALLALLVIGVFHEGYTQNLKARTYSVHTESSEEKQHYILHSASTEDAEILQKCIAKYRFWYKHRMLTKRRSIQVSAPYAATIELLSENELHQLYGKRIYQRISDNEADYPPIIFEVTPSGFKEVLLDRQTK